MAAPAATATHQEVRSQFPALASGFAFFENAGGSQLPKQVIGRMQALMAGGIAQIDAGYPASDRTTETAAAAKRFANVLMNGEGVGETLVGPTTTDLLYRLGNAYAETIEPGDEIVVSVANHEANVTPWLRLEKAGAKVVQWGVDPETGESSYEELGRLLGSRTRLVAVAHTSNVLGEIIDVRRVADMAHAAGAQVLVDGVAYAAHMAVDVKAWDADFYAVSLYKMYGPHVAALFGTTDAWSRLTGPNHDFVPRNAAMWKFELGCQAYEALAGVLGLADYLAFVAARSEGSHDRDTVEAAFAAMRAFELPLQAQLMKYLNSKSQLRVLGPTGSGVGDRHPTVCFVHRSKDSKAVVGQVNDGTVGIRYGRMYAPRLCDALGVHEENGVVRVSAVHYNSPEEMSLLIDSLEKAL
ncbi:MAG: aminotransferase class V-fold PLP-dependent enzyme [Armatimonadetes bacterium]|nr:aminotransferase class V-fold PLP-dependent enzyme [Armatimonadota bacterium]